MIFLAKSVVKEHLRRTKSGGVSVVHEYTDKRTKKLDDLDHRSEDYRYRDIGHVPGSRKELAAQQALQIREWGKAGRGVGVKDINWEALESNAREAHDLITKENIMRLVDWEAMQKRKVEPGAAYILYKLYAAVAPKPDDSAQARQDFVWGVNALQDRFAKAKTVDDVVDGLDEIKEEMTGFVLTSAQEKEWKKLKETSTKHLKVYHSLRREKDAVWEAYYKPDGRLQSMKWEQEKRTRRGWKPDPELQGRIDALQKEVDVLHQADAAWRKKNGARMDAAEKAYHESAQVRRGFEDKVRSTNLLSHPLTRGFNSLGARFAAAVHYRSYKGSDAFGKHVATAKAGKVKDYGFLDKGEREKTVSKQSVRFQLKVADEVKREGGRPLPAQDYSTESLQNEFGLANVQSGNWVLKDLNAAKHHTEQCALAFQDMADMLKIPDKDVSFHGRLSMAFGARGHGGTFGPGAAAHYENKYRVINLTKMRGGGSLAHEFFHFLDDVTGEVESGQRNGRATYATSITDPPRTETAQAMRGLVEAMTAGEHGVKTSKTITGSEADHWKKQFERSQRVNFYGASGARAIHEAGNLQGAMERLHEMFNSKAFGPPDGARAKRQYEYHKQMAVAVYAGTKGEYNVPGFKGSRFLVESQMIDAAENRAEDYWSSTKEMAARAFAGYMADNLHAAKRENTYLTSYADNKYYVLDGIKPYPEGEERKRINKAFDGLFAAIRKEKVLKKAEARWVQRCVFLLAK